MTEIFLQSAGLADGTTRYDLTGKDLPANFLGLAADIRFEKGFLEGDFMGMENGRIFQNLSLDQKPLVMAKALPDQGKLVLGISMKAKELPAVSDGILASFKMSSRAPAVTSFENQVLSTFDNGRKDLSAVIWSAGTVGSNVDAVKTVTQTADLGVFIEGKPVPEMSKGAVLAAPVVQAADLNETALLEALNLPFTTRDGENWGGWGWFWTGLLLIAVLGLAAVYIKYGKSASPAAWPKAERSQIKLDY